MQKRMTHRPHFLLLMVVLLGNTASAGMFTRLPEARLTIRAVDEEGLPLREMPVHVWLSESAIRDGETDEHGTFVAQGTCTIKDVPISIVRNGYYDSRVTYSYPNYLSVTNGIWQPWNPTVTVVVRRVVNPIPMYAKHIDGHGQHLRPNEWCAYDLVAGDWVRPTGKGVVTDILFRVSGTWHNYRNHDSVLTLAFPHTTDGVVPIVGPIVAGRLIIPFTAPTRGYEPTYVWHKSSKQGGPYYCNDTVTNECETVRTLLIRVRSSGSAFGVATNALYGKLRNVEFGGAATNGTRVSFTYYLNPTPNDTNIEMDLKKNLLKNLVGSENISWVGPNFE